MNKDNKKSIKLYTYPRMLPCVIIFFIVCILLSVLAILLEAHVAVWILPLLAFGLFYFIYYCKFFYVTQECIRMGKETIAWSDIKVMTCIFNLLNSRARATFLLFCKRDDLTKDTIKMIHKKKWYIKPDAKSLKVILGHYNEPIVNVDIYGDESKPIIMSKQCKLLLEEHNKKFDTVSISET